MTAIKEYVIVVDEQDNEIETAEKLTAHQLGFLHRAFSIFIFRQHPHTKELELLLQRRAANKYHSALLWTNTCCSHPRPGEDVKSAGERRLKEEFGFSTSLDNLGYFHYQAHFSNGLIENEIDHVLIGYIDPAITPQPDSAEIHEYQWITIPDLQQALAKKPEQFTAWFEKALNIILKNN
jgi:isopentenyl-diphosphate delta-isomerase